jgi:hypothetical protein
VPVKEDEESILRTLAEIYPTLKELRSANPIAATRFLEHMKHTSENWPTESLIEGYLDALP